MLNIVIIYNIMCSNRFTRDGCCNSSMTERPGKGLTTTYHDQDITILEIRSHDDAFGMPARFSYNDNIGSQ